MKTWIVPILFYLFISGCSPIGTETGPPGPVTPEPLPSATRTEPSATIPPASATPTSTPTDLPTVPPPTETPEIGLSVCSPLPDLLPSDLEDSITNPYNPPPFGSDDPHQGVDLANFLPGTRIGVGGGSVQAVLAGTVSLVVADRFPYGNAVMVETPIEALIAAGWAPSPLDEEIPILTTLTCPGETEIFADSQRQSLYLLYAHLQDIPTLAVGEVVACGGPLGRIGDTGNALNPHLHLEVRLGPSGAVFPGMSHYSAAASAAEMDSYCIWRVGGQFRPVDPLLILGMME